MYQYYCNHLIAKFTRVISTSYRRIQFITAGGPPPVPVISLAPPGTRQGTMELFDEGEFAVLVRKLCAVHKHECLGGWAAQPRTAAVAVRSLYVVVTSCHHIKTCVWRRLEKCVSLNIYIYMLNGFIIMLLCCSWVLLLIDLNSRYIPLALPWWRFANHLWWFLYMDLLKNTYPELVVSQT